MVTRALVVLLLAAGCGENLTHPAPVSDAAVLSCVPNLDGRIDAAELRAALGVAATYRTANDRSVDLVGQVDAGGRRVWDLAGAIDDPKVEIVAAPLVAQWYAGDFPAGRFVVPDGDLDGVYSEDDAGLWLHGLASRDQNPPGGRTLLVYDDPVPVVRFPLTDGLSWTATGRIAAGTLLGLPYVGSDRYDITVDGAGEVVLPELAFTQALRVRTLVTVMPDVGPARTRRQISFFFECFGEVARATSRDDEPAEEFTIAATLRRLAL